MGSIEDFRSEAHDWIEANLPSELRVGNRKDLPKELLGAWIQAMASRAILW